MVDVIQGWRKANANLLYWTFGGSDESIDMLWTMISDAKLINHGLHDGGRLERAKSLDTTIRRTFHTYANPELWVKWMTPQDL